MREGGKRGKMGGERGQTKRRGKGWMEGCNERKGWMNGWDREMKKLKEDSH